VTESLFSLADMREHAEHIKAHHGGVEIVDSDAVLALVTAVEAAREFRKRVINGIQVEGTTARRVLDDALAKFEWAE
jgi:Iap family predicted aminopeptidase